jgi:hypothetical protein
MPFVPFTKGGGKKDGKTPSKRAPIQKSMAKGGR